MSCFLAIDQSTSATKVLLFDANGSLLDKQAQEHRQHYPAPGQVEHDGDEIWTNTLEAARRLLHRHASRLNQIQSLSISNQRETIIVFDRTTGKPLAPAIVWQCRRGSAICDGHLRAGKGPLVENRTGLRIDPYFSASKLQWLVENNTTVAEQLASGQAVASTVDAFLIHRLTNGQVFACDHTNACRTLLYDIHQLNWDRELCDLWKVPPQSLPEIRDSTASYGETRLEGLLPHSIPICGVMGDSHASLLAQRCFEPGTAKVTFGTGSSILLNTGTQSQFQRSCFGDKADHQNQRSCFGDKAGHQNQSSRFGLSRHSSATADDKADDQQGGNGVITTLAWVHQGKPTYAAEGIVISSASTLNWLRDQLGILNDVAEAETIARSLPDNGGVYLVPAFNGLGLPHWKPDARASIVGLSSQSDRRHIIRAALEAIAYQIKDALDAMRGDSQTPLRAIHGDGGPTANTFLMQFTADITGVELRISDTPECSPLGAVLAGMLGSGRFADTAAITALPQSEKVFTPGQATQQTTRLHAGWQAAVRQTLQN